MPSYSSLYPPLPWPVAHGGAFPVPPPPLRLRLAPRRPTRPTQPSAMLEMKYQAQQAAPLCCASPPSHPTTGSTRAKRHTTGRKRGRKRRRSVGGGCSYGKVRCRTCGRTFTNKGNLANHTRWHHEPRHAKGGSEEEADEL